MKRQDDMLENKKKEEKKLECSEAASSRTNDVGKSCLKNKKSVKA